MADFVEESTAEESPALEGAAPAAASEESLPLVVESEPKTVVYCAICSLPPEYCEYGPNFELCLPWIQQNCPEALSAACLAEMLGEVTLDGEEGEEGDKKKKVKKGNPGPKKKAAVETRIVISRVQRQKRKFITTVVGLDTVPDLKLKDAAKVFGKKFSSGASVSDTAAGGKEIVIQGDVCFELPTLLISEFKVNPSSIFFQDEDSKGTLRPYA